MRTVFRTGLAGAALLLPLGCGEHLAVTVPFGGAEYLTYETRPTDLWYEHQYWVEEAVWFEEEWCCEDWYYDWFYYDEWYEDAWYYDEWYYYDDWCCEDWWYEFEYYDQYYYDDEWWWDEWFWPPRGPRMTASGLSCD